MRTITELINTILTADKEGSRQAVREVRKSVYSSQERKYDRIASIIEHAFVEYGKILEEWQQENFVMAISVMYFLHNRDNQPDFLFPWLFQLLQHKNGNIRHAAVRMIRSELGPLTYSIRFPGEKSHFHKLPKKKAKQILFGLRTNLNSLAKSSWKDSYKKYKYIDQLPSGTYKSTQLILGLLDEYCSEANYSASSQVETEPKQQILEHRKEVEQDVMAMLKETKSDFTLRDVRDAIYHEEDSDDMMKIVAMFDCGGDVSELSNVLELVTDAWNYFPHKVLDGISPAEKALEYQER